MRNSKNNTFHELISDEHRLILTSMKCDSFQEIAEQAGVELQASVIIADSLHHIIALSKDICNFYGSDITWIDLIRDGYAPPVVQNEPETSSPAFFSDEAIGKSLLIHSEIPTVANRCCIMCDVFNEDRQLILKVAVCSDESFDTQQKKSFLSLCFSLQLAYYRLNMNSGIDARGKYLLELLTNGGSSEKGFFTKNAFCSEGNFELVCFDTSGLGHHNLSFLPILANIQRIPDILSVMDGCFQVLLINKQNDVFSIYEQLDDFSKTNNFPIFISPHFSKLTATPENYHIVRQIATLGQNFVNIKGMHHTEEFSMFMLFENLDKNNPPEFLMHPDADVLFAYDAEKHTDYALTVYCYLFHNCEAPASAEALFIHRNTLDKRLRKIETMIQGEWHDITYQIIMLRCLYTGLKDLGKLPYYEPTVQWPLIFSP